MKKILAIGGSNSSKSINTEFATYIANQINDAKVTVFDWNKFELPLFGEDIEREKGAPESINTFLALIENSDAIILSLAEHNSLPSAAFKNLWDWTSRTEGKFWGSKPMLLASASPGGRGGVSALNTIKNIISHYAGNVITDFSLPKYYDNFKEGNLVNEELKSDLDQKIDTFQKAI